jgi:D-alanyl-D-alanine carboxypeptidase (penicillin-binding protein 5/6)
MGLRPKDKARVEDLLRGMIVVSGNDACIVLAEGISGSESAFAAEMTAAARKLGLETAQFDNASGLYTETQRISAEDLARLSRALIREFPEYYALYSEREFVWNGIRQPNRNRLLGTVAGADGVKTGHLSQSGYGMVASAVQEGRRIIVVINGMASEADRAAEAERLLRLGFSAFETRTIGTADAMIAELPVVLGQASRVAVALKDPVTLTAGKRALREARTEVVFKGPLRAPLKAGDVVAELEILVEGREPVRVPLHALVDVPRKGFVGRALDGFSAVLFGGKAN